MTRPDSLEQRLRGTLHATADDYRTMPLDRDLWERGRAPQPKRVRPELVAAAVVLIALLASVVALTRPDLVLQPADVPEGGALPTDVWLPELEDIADQRLDPLDAVGPISIATMLDHDTALLVDAENGEHHLRDLKGTWTVGTRVPRLSLSPDGTLLAHAFRSDEGAREEISSGVQVNNLLDGGATLLGLSNDNGDPIAVSSLQWSPDGSWLVWSGAAVDPAEGWIDESPWVGVVEVDADRFRQWQLPPEDGWQPTVAVADDGTVVVASSNKLWQVAPDLRSEVLDPRDARRLPRSPTGSGNGALNSAGTTLSLTSEESGNADLRSLDVDLTADPLTVSNRKWINTGQQMALWMHVLGRTPDSALLALDDGDLPRLQRSNGGSERIITEFHADNGMDPQDQKVTVAVGLGDATPATFVKPSWASNRLPWVILALVSPLLLVGGLLLVRRRGVRGWALAVGITLGLMMIVLGVVALRQDAGGWSVPGWFWLVLVIAVASLVAGIRLRRSGRYLFRGFGLALVLLLTLLYVSQPVWPSLAAPSDDGPALPRTVFAPSYDEGHADRADDGVDIERASVVVTSSLEKETVVVVDASTGKHHLVSLPGFNTVSQGDGRTTAFALSHDGRRLAWQYADFETDEAGIALVELADAGDLTDPSTVRRLPLVGRKGLPVKVDTISWSPDGSHLAWFGNEANQWRDDITTFYGKVRTYGATATSDLTPGFHVTQGNFEGTGVAGVDDDGRGHTLFGRDLFSFTVGDDSGPSSRRVSTRDLPWSSAAVSPDGRTLAVGVNGGLYVDGIATGLRTLDLTAQKASLVLHPWHAPRDGDRVDVVGHAPDGAPVVVHETARDDVAKGPDVVVLDRAEGRVTSTVARPYSAEVATVATDLVDHATLDVPEPRWPVSDERWVAIGLVAAMFLIELGRLALRRRRRPSAGESPAHI